MYRGFLATIGGAALVMAGLAGCSSDDNGSTAADTTTTTTTAETTPTATGDAAAQAATVSIDGQDQHIQGTVACSQTGDDVTIAIGDVTQGVGATVSAGDDPRVIRVGLGNVDGAVLGFQEGTDEGEATAEKDGETYKIKGTATGAELADPMRKVSKPFEIEVTCP